jgi:hypothetical protein
MRAATGRPAGDGVRDDTAAIQALLDAGSPVVRLPAPARHYLISRPLRIHAGQALELDRFAHIRLAPRSDCLMLENVDQESGDANIAVRGGIWDMDNLRQTPNPLAVPTPALKAQTTYVASTYLGIGMRFVKVRGLTLEGLTFKDPVTFCVQLVMVRDFTVDDVTFDFNMGNPIPGNMDGIHLDGGCRFGRISNLKGTTYDDLVALNADDSFDSPCHGPISDIEIDGIFAEGAHSAVRILSNHSPVERISISNVYGTFYQYGIGISNIFPGDPSDGVFDAIELANIFAAKAERKPVFLKDDHPVFPIVWVERGCRVGSLSIRGLHRLETFTPVECVAVARGASVQSLYASGCSWRNDTGQAAAFLGNEGEIGSLVLEGIRTGGDRLLDNRGSIGAMVLDGERSTAVPAEAPPAKPRWRY